MEPQYFDSTSFLFLMGVLVIGIVSLWKIYTKAGQPGWTCIVPIYSFIVLMKIARQPLWHFFLYFIPFINIYAAWKTVSGVSTGFGKGTGFALGLFFLPFIFYPIIAFGEAEYAKAPVNEEAVSG
jgi:hypothetical protein